MYIVLKIRSTTFADLTDKFPIKFLFGANVSKQNLLISIINVVLFWTDRNGVVIVDGLQCCYSEPITMVLY
jgi:hypothetical protein